jgi:gamma-F420-2:alpha-L-glutamate ligase
MEEGKSQAVAAVGVEGNTSVLIGDVQEKQQGNDSAVASIKPVTVPSLSLEESVQLQAGYSSGNDEPDENVPQFVEIKVPKVDLKYNLKPQVIGESGIVFYNAQDLSYYRRQLKEPFLRVWVLTSNANDLKYVNKRIFEAGYANNIQVDFMETGKFDLVSSQDGLDEIYYDGQTVKLPDVVLPRLGANIDYFGMAVIRHLENANLLVLNPTHSVIISRDKLYQVQHLAIMGLPFPKTMIAKFPINFETVEKVFPEYPIVLKKASGSQGKGVILCHSREQLSDLADMIDTTKPCIFQEYIKKSHGRDIRVFVVGGKAIGGMMRIAKKGFKANFHQGGTVKPIKLSPAIEWLAIEAARLVGLDIAGVDILIDNDSYKICEINSSPGFQGFELATGINVPEYIFDFIKIRLGLWRKTNPRAANTEKKRIAVPVQAEHLLLNTSNIPTTPNSAPQSPHEFESPLPFNASNINNGKQEK